MVMGCARPQAPVSPEPSGASAPAQPADVASGTTTSTPPAGATSDAADTAVAASDPDEERYKRAVHASTHAAERNEALLTVRCGDKQNGVEWKDSKCSRVKVASVMPAESLQYWKGRTSPEWQYLTWVTVAPELGRFCSAPERASLSPDELMIRVQQWLGLPKTKRYDKVIEVWVDPARLRRPCSNPNIQVAECRAQGKIECAGDASCEVFKLWLDYNDLKNQAAGNYPFTRLGYTYDWAEVSATPEKPGLGATEFVLLPDTPYEVVKPGARDLTEYCARP